MKTNMPDPQKIIESLVPWLNRGTAIIVVVGRFGGSTNTGELMNIGEREISICSDDEEIIIPRDTIESLNHDPLPTAALPRMMVA